MAGSGNSFSDDGRERFTAFLKEELGPLVPDLWQLQPSDPPLPPKPWLNPITGEPLPNPWLTEDNNAKKILITRDPALARCFQALARNPYGTVAEMQDAQTAATRRKAIKYNAETHLSNPFVTGNHTESSRLMVTDPERGAFYKREAKPLSLPWQAGARNLTGMGRLATRPEIRAMAGRAEELQQLWLTEQLSYTKSQLERNATEAQQLEAALNGGGKKVYARR